MQFTGLKDKNDKNIYEGDFAVQRYTQALGIDCEERVVVEYRDGHTFMGRYYIDMAGSREVEIIGNIYENPESPQ